MDGLRRGVEPEVVAVYETVAAFFTEIYVNTMYRQLPPGNRSSDTYCYNVTGFATRLKTNKADYAAITDKLYQYFTSVPDASGRARHAGLTHAEFTAVVVQASVPPRDYKRLSGSQRSEFLAAILTDLVSTLAVAVCAPDMLARIVTNRNASAVERVQDCAVDALLVYRSKLHAKFQGRALQVPESVPANVVAALKENLTRMATEKAELAVKLRRSEEALLHANEAAAALKKQVRRLKRRIEELEQQSSVEEGSEQSGGDESGEESGEASEKEAPVAKAAAAARTPQHAAAAPKATFQPPPPKIAARVKPAAPPNFYAAAAPQGGASTAAVVAPQPAAPQAAAPQAAVAPQAAAAPQAGETPEQRSQRIAAARRALEEED